MFFNALLLAASLVAAVDNKELQDREAILRLAGTYKVTFQFAETFAGDMKYKLHTPYYADGLEWIGVVENNPGNVVLQHLLVDEKKTIIKHWREDWVYQNTTLLHYDKHFKWDKSTLSNGQVKGQWTQKVYQVDDGPRYEASGTWVHVDGHSEWQATSDAPLPRREFTKRHDYNVLRRTNRITVLADRWLHQEENVKIIRGDRDSILTEELGKNAYVRVDDSLGRPALDWWKTHSAFWQLVRDVWKEITAANTSIALDLEKTSPSLHESMFDLDKRLSATDMKNVATVKRSIREVIDRFMVSATSKAVN